MHRNEYSYTCGALDMEASHSLLLRSGFVRPRIEGCEKNNEIQSMGSGASDGELLGGVRASPILHGKHRKREGDPNNELSP